MLIALLCESEMKLADETIEMILDKVSGVSHNLHKFIAVTFFCFLLLHCPLPHRDLLVVMLVLMQSLADICGSRHRPGWKNRQVRMAQLCDSKPFVVEDHDTPISEVIFYCLPSYPQSP